MQWTSIVAIYALVWVMTAFVSLSFGIRTHDEMGEAKIPGQADSAPANFQPGKLALRSTAIAAILTAVYVLNYEYGWVGIDDINPFPDPPSMRGNSDQ
jgi:predicted secreted protein